MIGGGVDAHQIAPAVDQSATRVAGIDGGVGLQQILPAIAVRPHAGETGATGRTDDPLGDGLADVVGVADGKHHVAHLGLVVLILRDHRQVIRFDVEHCQIGELIGADQLGAEDAAILQGDDDLIGIGDDVVVGQHIAALVHDDARAQPLWPEFRLIALIGGKAAGIDVDDCRAGAVGGVGEAQFAGVGDQAGQLSPATEIGKQQQQQCGDGQTETDRLAQVTD